MIIDKISIIFSIVYLQVQLVQHVPMMRYVQTLPSPVVMELAVYVIPGTRTTALETTVMVHVYISAFLQQVIFEHSLTSFAEIKIELTRTMYKRIHQEPYMLKQYKAWRQLFQTDKYFRLR